MSSLSHDFPFDPSYGHSLDTLLAVEAPEEPSSFADFWKARYLGALSVDPSPKLKATGQRRGLRVHDLAYQSTDETTIGGWCLVPAHGEVERAFVVLHGYGGRDEPDFHLPLGDRTALIFPCARGISRSRHRSLPADPGKHVLHEIGDPDRYVIGGCVDDVWTAVSAAEALFPEATGRIGLLGISFGGGLGALALPWDVRIARAHFNVPTFGHQPLRLTLDTVGSGASVIDYHRDHPDVTETLQLFDAALAARRIAVPVHYACALFDPFVAPPGQFAIHNATPQRELYLLQAGHFDYPDLMRETMGLLREINEFFDAV